VPDYALPNLKSKTQLSEMMTTYVDKNKSQIYHLIKTNLDDRLSKLIDLYDSDGEYDYGDWDSEIKYIINTSIGTRIFFAVELNDESPFKQLSDDYIINYNPNIRYTDEEGIFEMELIYFSNS